MLLDKNIPLRYILNKIKYDLPGVLVLLVVIYGLKILLADDFPLIPISLPLVTGTSVSLLLALRLHHAYERWWEAGKIWEAIVNDSRNLVLALQAYLSETTLAANERQTLIRKMAYRQVAWCYCLGQSLRGLDALRILDPYISESEIKEIKKHANRPLCILMFHMKDLKKIHTEKHLNDHQQISLCDTIIRLSASMGKAERINETVFPPAYRWVIHALIYLFLSLLSLSLASSIGFYGIPLLILVAAVFFLVEKTAIHMQDPFKDKPEDTAVTALGRMVEINLKQLLKEKNISEPVKPNDFFTL